MQDLPILVWNILPVIPLQGILKDKDVMPVKKDPDPSPQQIVSLILERVKVAAVRETRTYRLGMVLALSEPAKAEGPAMALKSLSHVSMENGLGTPRPPKLVTALDNTKTHLYLMPAPATVTEDTFDIAYGRYGFQVNLYDLFKMLNCLVPKGFREFYKLEVTPEPIRIDNIVGKALVIELGNPERVPIHELPEEKKRERKAKQARSATPEGVK